MSSGNFLPTFPETSVKNCHYHIGCPETSVSNYHYSLRNNPKERICHLLRGVSLKSCTSFVTHYANKRALAKHVRVTESVFRASSYRTAMNALCARGETCVWGHCRRFCERQWRLLLNKVCIPAGDLSVILSVNKTWYCFSTLKQLEERNAAGTGQRSIIIYKQLSPPDNFHDFFSYNWFYTPHKKQ